MDNHQNKDTYQSGETPGVGVYICTQCHFAIVVVKDNFILPSCPCCENDQFTRSNEAEFDD
ncbi:hypothetical protein L3Q72_18755 [Vibrio sp. JC009]|uniref:zinc ribbon-containing protein n=1 Tax=Vibrio sp. JC009 TaxID=2912314 RepID=UPI0023B0B37E|nr:hypothetical protein [Vibrio sp. JC009]WED24916.1 hypothetical protein L3Q72_18755 [Vibrio sp. JC009]